MPLAAKLPAGGVSGGLIAKSGGFPGNSPSNSRFPVEERSSFCRENVDTM